MVQKIASIMLTKRFNIPYTLQPKPAIQSNSLDEPERLYEVLTSFIRASYMFPKYINHMGEFAN
jgi:hypothetical protein